MGANQGDKPSVLFVCVKNGGKSQMAAGLMRHLAGDQVHVDSAGTRPGGHLNAESVASLQEVGIDISGGSPKPVTDELVELADLVVVLGGDPHRRNAGGDLGHRRTVDARHQRS